MFPVFVNDGTREMPDDDILYIVCKEGTYLKKKLGIMESITPVKEISVLKTVEMMATMHIKPIPGTVFAPIMDFFKKVYMEHRSEAIVLLFYNEENKTYKVIPPAQEVSGASVDYTRAMTLDGYIMIGDIHSHADFSAFHSGVDDNDEKSFDGLHITIGNNGDDEVSISSSIVSNGKRFICQPEDYINGIKLTVDIDEVVDKPFSNYYMWDAKSKKMVQRESTRTYKVKRFDKRYVSSVSKKYQKCPDEWLKLVKKKTYQSYASGYGWENGRWSGYGNWRNWDTNKFDPDVWKNRRPIPPQARPPLVPQTTKPITFPPHDQTPKTSGPLEEVLEPEFNPCEKCPFSHHKIDWVMEQIAGGELDDNDVDIPPGFGDDNGIDWYECDRCNEIFSTTDVEAVCPNCKVDDFLILLDEDDFKDFSARNINTPETYNFKCKECGTETSTLNHGQCPFCGGDVLNIVDEEYLKAAKEEDEAMKSLPIPIPDDNKIPIESEKTQRRKFGIFANLFNRDKK